MFYMSSNANLVWLRRLRILRRMMRLHWRCFLLGAGGVMTGWGFGGLVYVTHDHERAGSTAETARNCEAAIPLRLSGVNFGFGFQG